LESIRSQKILPEFVPILDGSDPESFLTEANRYLDEVVKFYHPVGVNLGVESYVEARSELSTYMEADEHIQLHKDIAEARNALNALEAKKPLPLPMPQEDLATLSETQRIGEEIYSIQYQVLSSPLAKGENLRDRWEPVHEDLEELREKFRKETFHQRLEYRDQRINDLESILTSE
jgi:hypothetical protein